MHKGYLCLMLHAHLPFVRHPEEEYFLEENWLYEAITETYIPLIKVFERLSKDNVDFPCYSDCEDIQVKANFPAIFGATLTKIGPILKDTHVYWQDNDNQISGSTGDWEKLTICLDAWKAEIWRAAEPTPNAKVGEITINVKPPDTGS